MAFEVNVLSDTATDRGHRLTTFELVYPRIIHADFLTHREVSRNAESSRAKPTAKIIEAIRAEPFDPHWRVKAASGMQPAGPADIKTAAKAQAIWERMREHVLSGVQELADLGIAKELANRPLEAFQWYRVLASATNWSNFLALRTDDGAQEELRVIAKMIGQRLAEDTPRLLEPGQWALPLTTASEWEEAHSSPELLELYKQVSTGRCARISYTTHHGVRDTDQDVRLFDGLLADVHMSPFEHQATPMTDREYDQDPRSGNFTGFMQHRKLIPGEYYESFSQAA